uniref:DUF4200 domain-containing protein n=1 Tax=Pygocentrus nattereri TaxID=42514 RepID=A0A3B4EPY6_PYGNA
MKTTYLSRLRCHSSPVRSAVEDSVLETEKSRRNRTMRYSLSVKRETIHKLKKEMDTEQYRINLYEKQLQEDEVAFEQFINEIDQNSAEAVNLEISKYQETLTKYQTCKNFLMDVAPPQWREEQSQKREQKREAKRKERMKEMELNPTFLSPNIEGKFEKKIFLEPALCFSDPKEMLSILTELEEQNLSYIQNFQETEEAMDVIRKTAQHSQDKMNHEIQHLIQQIEIMQATIQREQENVLELQLKSKIFSYGEYSADKQVIKDFLKEVYMACLGELDCNISTLHMLACIENKVVDVLEHLETMPPETVDFVRSLRDKEKRTKIREEKARLKKQHQEESFYIITSAFSFVVRVPSRRRIWLKTMAFNSISKSTETAFIAQSTTILQT